MLKAAKDDMYPFLNSFSKKHPLAVHTMCKMKAYGTERDFFKVWYSEIDGKITFLISSFYGNINICADSNADFDEIAMFLDFYGYESICAEKQTLLNCKLKATSEKTMFKYSGSSFENRLSISNSADLKEVYSLISHSIPNSFSNSTEAYLSFLSDFTFRQRRKAARIKTVEENEKVVSCALTAAESEYAALISGVACSSEMRGRGYGKETVLALANELKNENKDVYVIALNDSAQKFYKKIGFYEILKVGYIERQ